MAGERVLGIETSCDETSAAVLAFQDGRLALESLVILSQDVHAVFGGVVPELASRAHLQTVGRVVDRALSDAGTTVDGIDGIAVTAGPGLIGALLVGLTYGKTLAWRAGLPMIGVHHLEGHLFAPTLEHPDLAPPFVALLVSGGHTLLLEVRAWDDYRLLGQTRDDAAGEAFDKVGKLLGLGYPAGPEIERLAREGTPGQFRFPRPMLGAEGPDRFAFSFSGLKTSVRRAVATSGNLDHDRRDIARGFQEAVVDVLTQKTIAAAQESDLDTIVLGGGVACNRALTEAMVERAGSATRVVNASPRLNADNAAMIAAAGSWRLRRGETSAWSLEASDRMPLPGLSTEHQHSQRMTA